MDLRQRQRLNTHALNVRRDARPQSMPAQHNGQGVTFGGNPLRAQTVSNGAMGNGEGVALSSDSGLVQQELRRVRRGESGGRAANQSGAVKILASWNDKFYVGGHVSAPIFVYESPPNFSIRAAHLTNTGKSKNDFVVGIQYIKPDGNFFHITKYGDGREYSFSSDLEYGWQGDGFWLGRSAPNDSWGWAGGSVKYPVASETFKSTDWVAGTAIGYGNRKHEGFPSPRFSGVNYYEQDWQTRIDNDFGAEFTQDYKSYYKRNISTAVGWLTFFDGQANEYNGTFSFDFIYKIDFFERRININGHVLPGTFIERDEKSNSLEAGTFPIGNNGTTNVTKEYISSYYLRIEEDPYSTGIGYRPTFDSTFLNMSFPATVNLDAPYFITSQSVNGGNSGTPLTVVFGNAQNTLYAKATNGRGVRMSALDRSFYPTIDNADFQTYWRSPRGDRPITIEKYSTTKPFWDRSFQVDGENLLDHRIFQPSGGNQRTVLAEDVEVLIETNTLTSSWILSQKMVKLKSLRVPNNASGIVWRAAYF